MYLKKEQIIDLLFHQIGSKFMFVRCVHSVSFSFLLKPKDLSLSIIKMKRQLYCEQKFKTSVKRIHSLPKKEGNYNQNLPKLNEKRLKLHRGPSFFKKASFNQLKILEGHQRKGNEKNHQGKCSESTGSRQNYAENDRISYYKQYAPCRNKQKKYEKSPFGRHSVPSELGEKNVLQFLGDSGDQNQVKVSEITKGRQSNLSLPDGHTMRSVWEQQTTITRMNTRRKAKTQYVTPELIKLKFQHKQALLVHSYLSMSHADICRMSLQKKERDSPKCKKSFSLPKNSSSYFKSYELKKRLTLK